MRWIVKAGRRPLSFQLSSPGRQRRALATVSQLDAGGVDAFKREAFDPGKPVKLAQDRKHLPPACSEWFVNDERCNGTELRASFWSQFKDTVVPLEVTSKTPGGISNTPSLSTFRRAEAPLGILLAYLDQASSEQVEPDHSIYLAQCSLHSLPKRFRDDLPAPEVVMKAGKGDIYDSSLWLGCSPTYTPLHRDPNPNFLLQLAGKKVVRLLPPEIGGALFNEIQDELHQSGGASSGSASFRGEEMMSGPEADLLHAAMWEPVIETRDFVQQYGQQVEIDATEALFIPKGWWHSVKGIGKGVTASANWWFR